MQRNSYQYFEEEALFGLEEINATKQTFVGPALDQNTVRY